ncbi:MAG: diguanylate cyclase, partial [Acidobacteriota bacterium]
MSKGCFPGVGFAHIYRVTSSADSRASETFAELDAELWAEEPPFSIDEPRRPVVGIRLKVLTLVAFSVLVPTSLIGTASYLTARDILVEKVGDQLSTRASTAAQRVEQWLEERSSDTNVFASSFVVSENLQAWNHAQRRSNRLFADDAKGRIEEYLAQVQDRYPLYRGLLVTDEKENLFALAGQLDWHRPEGGAFPLTAGLRQPSPARREFFLYAAAPVEDRDGNQIGTLVTVSELADLWGRLDAGWQPERGELRRVDSAGTPVLDGRADPPDVPTDRATAGVRACLDGHDGIREDLDGRGTRVLGAYRYLPTHKLGLLVEMDSEEAFAAVRRLQRLSLLISALAAALVMGMAYFLVVNLLRPIEALIAGAESVSTGEFSVEIPVESRDEIGYLTSVFNRMTGALRKRHATLSQQSITDELTGLFNRRQLKRAFATQLSRFERQQDPFSVLMIDLDRFKAFNDRFGHVKGDDLLREVGELLTATIRPTDMAARYGGEEFVMLLAGTGKEDAARKAEELRMAFIDSRATREDSATVTLSIGVAACPEDGVTEEQLIKKADDALYEAKRAG